MQNVYQQSGTHGTLVVAYLRKSSAGKDKQEASIAGQREAIQKYCDARGWIIMAWYVDDGKSGSINQHKRVEFQRMIAEASGAKWAGVVVWNTSRFGRTNSMEEDAGAKLHTAGKWLETVTEGRLNWSTSMGRLQWAMVKESNNALSVKLSEDSTRGRKQALEAGYWAHGRVPFGYDRLYVKDGLEPVRMTRNAKAGRPTYYHLKLEINEAEAKVVKWIFEQFNGGRSMRWIAGQLTKQGHPTPYQREHGWMSTTVRQVIQQPAYIGRCTSTFSHLKYSKGKFNSLNGIVMEGVTPVIIDADVWASAQVALTTRKRRFLYSSKERQSGVLSGLITCGHCGYKLKKGQRKQRVCATCGCNVARKTLDGRCMICNGKSGEKYTTSTFYYCATNAYHPEAGCRQHVGYESEILPAVRDKLLSRIEETVLRKVLAQPADATNAELSGLEKRRDDLKKMVAKATRNILMLDDVEIITELQAQLRKWKDELEAAEAQIKMAATATPDERRRLTGWLDEIKGQMIRLTDTQYRRPAPDGQIAQLDFEKVDGIDTSREALAGLLTKLGVNVALHWRRKNATGMAETLDYADISARFDVDTATGVTSLPLTGSVMSWQMIR